MPMHDAMELMGYWQDYPPVHVLMRSQFKFEPATKFDDRRKGVSEKIHARKVTNAPPRDREIFELLRAHG